MFLAKYDFKLDFDKFISSIAVLGIISSTFFVILLLIFENYIIYLLGIENYAFYIFCIYLVTCQIPGILIAKLRVEQDYKRTVFITIILSVITTLFAILGTLLFENHLKGRIIGFYVPNIIINIFLFIIYIYKIHSFSWKYCKYALNICVPLIVHNLSGNIMHMFDRIMIERIISAESSGYYSVAYSCAIMANLFRNSMVSAWEPWFYDKINSKEYDDIKKMSYFCLVVFFVLCIFIILLAPEVVTIVGGKKYLVSINVIPPVVTAYMFSMVYSLYAVIEQYYKKQKYFAIVAVVCALMNVCLNYIFLPKYGYIVASYTTLICLALEFVLHYINVAKMHLNYIYNNIFNVSILFLMILFSFLSIFLYHINLLRWFIILLVLLAFVVFLILKRNMIKQFISVLIK